MPHVSPSFSATLRVRLDDTPGAFARLASAIGEAEGLLGAIDIVRVEPRHKVRDVTVSPADEEHLHRITEAVRAVEGVEVLRISDRTFPSNSLPRYFLMVFALAGDSTMTRLLLISSVQKKQCPLGAGIGVVQCLYAST